MAADPAPDDEEKQKKPSRPDLLSLVRSEMRQAIGLGNDVELQSARDMALRFIKGDMKKEVPSLPNRSKAVSSDIADAVASMSADLMEIFTGGDDVVALVPIKAQDVDAAAQETAYLKKVAFQDNEGFLNILTAILDGLVTKTLVFMVSWEQDIEDDDEEFSGKNAAEMQLAQQDGTVSGVKQDSAPEGVDIRLTEPTYSFTITRRTDKSKAKYWAVPSEDFAVSPDTVVIADATYCVMRSRPRVQDLIAEGYDEALVRALPAYSAPANDTTSARDTAGEHERTQGDNTDDNLRQVEVRKHYIRTLADDGEMCIYEVITDAEATVEIASDEVARIPFAAGSPYLVAHRFYGQSLADLLIEIQKIRTVLMRGMLDSMYFSLNQRVVVADRGKNDFTMSDLLQPSPGLPIRVADIAAVQPLQSSGPGFDYDRAMEFFASVAELRTGVVRNAQGLAADSLHDTKGGMLALLSAAQKRTKMVARVIAETVIKPLFLLLHATIRENDTAQHEFDYLGKWTPVDPTKWAERNEMTVQVGLGASGKDMEIASMEKIAGLMTSIVQEQGGADGPIVTLQNVYEAATDYAKKLGERAPEKYFSDPAKAPPQQPKPDPEVMKVQAKAQADQQTTVATLQSKERIAQTEAEFKAKTDQNLNMLEDQRHQREIAAQDAADARKQQADYAFRMAELDHTERLEMYKADKAQETAIEVARINARATLGAAEEAAASNQVRADESAMA